MGFFSGVSHFVVDSGIMSWDVLLTLLNLMRRKRKVGHVTPEGHPGYGGSWPEFRPPKEGDSRCACPALNAMANHGIISRNGREISFVELNHHIRATFNFSASFCTYTPLYASRMLKKSYTKDTFDLEDLNLHNGIEHDASLCRLDTALQPDQSVKHVPFLEEMLALSTAKDKHGNAILTTKDFSKISGKRRAVARAVNKEFSLALSHKIFASTNAAILLTIFGGRVDDMRTVLIEERLPEGWESRIRQPHGLTLLNCNKTTFAVEFGIREKDWAEVAQEEAKGKSAVTV
ncbi:Cloroperoxidase [Rhizopogon salebrosus TDB-379]|nr:Cloroperoxidase [Rhizopogon salebrosus TDB-379]